MSGQFAGYHSQISDFLKASDDFIIPEYQREYSWKPENIDQLLDDLEQGIRKLNKHESQADRKNHGAKFLGCVIQWDRIATSGDEYIETQGVNYISRASELIDGQQRTSTAILFLCEIYFSLDKISENLDKTIQEESALFDFCINVQENWLLPCFSKSGLTGAQPKNRPSLIRQGTDKWTHSGKTHYTSALASYVCSLLIAIDQRPSPLQRPTLVGKEILEVVERLKEKIEERIENPFEYLQSNYDHQELFSALRFNRAHVNLEAYLITNPANKKLILGAISLISLVHYFLNYCAFTVIKSSDQDIALDMFQSLNSTGVQLTAVQLLKPRISQSFRLNGTVFSSDTIFDTYEKVNEWLNSGKDSNSKTNHFFLKFGLSIFGENVGSSLSSQRTWLLRKYNDFSSTGSNIDKTREFIRLMRHTSDYLDNFYLPKRSILFTATAPPASTGSRNKYERFRIEDSAGTSYLLSDSVVIALMFVLDAGHDLAHTFFSLFYTKFKEQTPNTALKAKEEFEKIILSVTATFILFRTALGIYPDEAYRVVLGSINYLNFDGTSRQINKMLIKQLSKNKRNLHKTNNLQELLSKGLRYKKGYEKIIRFSLILAAHRKITVGSSDSRFIEHGMVSADKAGPDYLHPDIWLGAEYNSIEHIAPQKLMDWSGSVPVAHWGMNFLNAETIIHSIGNLTLLSNSLNAAIPEDTNNKLVHYGSLIGYSTASGATPKAAELMASSPSLSHLVPVYVRLHHWLDDLKRSSSIPSANDWDLKFIQRRAENISAVIIKDLLGWLRT